MSWMQRLKRVFAIDIETCPDCGGTLKVIACIEDPPLIAKILGHVRSREAGAAAQARAPPADSQQVLKLLHRFSPAPRRFGLRQLRAEKYGVYHGSWISRLNNEAA